MHAFDVLGDPVRRRLVELLARRDRTSGDLTDVIRAEFGISQPAVSNHLRVLRDAGFAQSVPEGSRRVYSLNGARMDRGAVLGGRTARLLGESTRRSRDRAHAREQGFPVGHEEKEDA